MDFHIYSRVTTIMQCMFNQSQVRETRAHTIAIAQQRFVMCSKLNGLPQLQ